MLEIDFWKHFYEHNKYSNNLTPITAIGNRYEGWMMGFFRPDHRNTFMVIANVLCITFVHTATQRTL